MVDESAAPPSGVWKGLAVNGTHAIQTDLRLIFENGRVNGSFSLHSDRRPSSGEVVGTIHGTNLTLTQSGTERHFDGHVQAVNGRWILFGLMVPASADESVGTLTAYAEDEKYESEGVWAGGSFA